MKKVSLVVLEKDPTYMEFISHYIRTTEMKDKIDLKMFTEPSSFKRFMTNHPEVNITLMSEELLEDWELDWVQNVCDMVVLLQEKVVHRPAYRTQFKFQPADQLLSAVLSHFFDEYGTHITKGNHKTKVLSVYSPMGGVGKTTLSVNASRHLALLGYKVFYFNLELFNSTSLFFQSPEDEYTQQLFYYAKSKPDVLPSKLHHLIKQDAYNQVDYFDLAVNPEEMEAWTGEEFRVVLQALLQSGHYDFIVLDLDTSIKNFTKEAIKVCDSVLWVLTNDVKTFHKSHYFLSYFDKLMDAELDIREKTFFLMNGYVGNLPKEYERFDVPVHVQLPKVDEWEYLTSGRDVTTKSILPKHFIQLLVEDDVRDGVKLG
ncbi:AAA family ATPase [Pontibacillus salicampi]|uniref:AAA family ATPase n=1 Tax=Pontibacillus salicampi TaxID=1449801 RepID=A0ABV6LUC0_9BACI